MGLSKFLILRTLYNGPAHGYILLGKVSEFTKGCCTPTFGTIYPILKELFKGGYVSVKPEVVDGRKRNVYELTEKGKGAYQVAFATWREVVPYLDRVIKDGC